MLKFDNFYRCRSFFLFDVSKSYGSVSIIFLFCFQNFFLSNMTSGSRIVYLFYKSLFFLFYLQTLNWTGLIFCPINNFYFGRLVKNLNFLLYWNYFLFFLPRHNWFMILQFRRVFFNTKKKMASGLS